VTAFRALLVAMFILISAYTVVAVMNDGPQLFAYFLRDVAALGWPGQFNTDFSCYLLLSGLWVAWRQQFSASGIFLGVLASVLGIIFLSLYLLIASFRTGGDVRQMLLGSRAD